MLYSGTAHAESESVVQKILTNFPEQLESQNHFSPKPIFTTFEDYLTKTQVEPQQSIYFSNNHKTL